MFEVTFLLLKSSSMESQLILLSVFPLDLYHHALGWLQCDLIQVHGLSDLQLISFNISAVQHYFSNIFVRRFE